MQLQNSSMRHAVPLRSGQRRVEKSFPKHERCPGLLLAPHLKAPKLPTFGRKRQKPSWQYKAEGINQARCPDFFPR